MKRKVFLLSLLSVFISFTIIGCRDDLFKSSESEELEFTEFSFDSLPTAQVTIDSQNNTIDVVTPYGTSLTSLVATFETNADEVSVMGTVQESGITGNTFLYAVEYTLTDEDLSFTYTVTVTNAVLLSIDITPSRIDLPPTGLIRQMTAWGYFSDSTYVDITGIATWTSTSPSFCTVSNTISYEGEITTVAAGTTSISASYSGVSSDALSATINVVNEMCVSNAGNDTSGDGASDNPYLTIDKGISEAASGPYGVRVAQGTYDEGELIMVEGVSLSGGWSTSFYYNDPTVYTTTINALDDTGISAGSGVTFATSIGGFTINGRDSSGTSVQAISMNSGGLTIENNIIYAGGFSGSAVGATGIYQSNAAYTVIRNNRVSAGNPSGTATAIRINGVGGEVYNNVVYGGGANSGSKYAIYKGTTSGTLNIRNNTIDAGASGAPYCIFLYAGTGPVYIENNLIFSTGPNGIGISEYVEAATPTSVQNNNIFSIPSTYFYYEAHVSAPYSTVSAMEADLNGETGVTAANNYEDDISAYFLNTTDYTLSSSVPSPVKDGGIDGSPTGAAWGYDYDHTKTTRTGDTSIGWTIGAYEMD
ncbi:MAG: hypothetical protein GY754_29115 [bacterium]|nr:hypothetical protein [bacterium]